MRNRKNRNLVHRRISGQGLIEYLILVCLIAISAVAVVSVVGANIREQYARISHSISNRKTQVPLSTPNADSYRVRGLDDYTKSAHTGTSSAGE